MRNWHDINLMSYSHFVLLIEKRMEEHNLNNSKVIPTEKSQSVFEFYIEKSKLLLFCY